jgi:hypothetical protein
MQREWSAEELIGSWTLVDEDWRLVSNKSGPTRLGFALLLKGCSQGKPRTRLGLGWGRIRGLSNNRTASGVSG